MTRDTYEKAMAVVLELHKVIDEAIESIAVEKQRIAEEALELAA